MTSVTGTKVDDRICTPRFRGVASDSLLHYLRPDRQDHRTPCHGRHPGPQDYRLADRDLQIGREDRVPRILERDAQAHRAVLRPASHLHEPSTEGQPIAPPDLPAQALAHITPRTPPHHRLDRKSTRLNSSH